MQTKPIIFSAEMMVQAAVEKFSTVISWAAL